MSTRSVNVSVDPMSTTIHHIFNRPLTVFNPQPSGEVVSYACALMEKLDRDDWRLIEGLLAAQRRQMSTAECGTCGFVGLTFATDADGDPLCLECTGSWVGTTATNLKTND